MDHVHHTGCHVTFRLHSTLAYSEFDTLFLLLYTLEYSQFPHSEIVWLQSEQCSDACLSWSVLFACFSVVVMVEVINCCGLSLKSPQLIQLSSSGLFSM